MATQTSEATVGDLVHQVAQAYNAVLGTKIGDLTPRQLAVLRTVARNEGLSQTDIVDRTGIDRSTLADIVRRMQRKGLLQRRRTKEDARAYAVKLTAEGHKTLKAAEKPTEKLETEINAKAARGPLERLLQSLDSLQRTEAS
jgi:DNA-binding MarR family transcriptional regulator